MEELTNDVFWSNVAHCLIEKTHNFMDLYNFKNEFKLGFDEMLSAFQYAQIVNTLDSAVKHYVQAQIPTGLQIYRDVCVMKLSEIITKGCERETPRN